MNSVSSPKKPTPSPSVFILERQVWDNLDEFHRTAAEILHKQNRLVINEEVKV